MSKDDYNWRDVLIMANNLETAVKNNETNRVRYQQLNVVILDTEKKIADLTATINRCTSIYNDVKENLTNKKQFMLSKYKTAISQAGSIVRNSSVDGAELKYDGKRAVIVNKTKQSLNAREGAALRSINGMMMRYSTMTSHSEFLPLVVLDETFFTLSENTSMEMKEYLAAFADDLLIIGIEQHDTLFAGIPGIIRYEFVKQRDGNSKIIKEKQTSA